MAEDIHKLQQELEALKALATGPSAGVKRLSINGRTVEYRDMADIELAIARKERELRIATGQLLRNPWRRTRIRQGWF
jgi:hypothetical protein